MKKPLLITEQNYTIIIPCHFMFYWTTKIMNKESKKELFYLP